nr:winged helix-turn-helix transcriptional regulator [uncultured Sphaerochaeta sp.]
MNKPFSYNLMQSEHTPKEFSILSYIEQNSDATQRQLSEHVGVSLGMINILLKRLVKKGLVKIERLQPNSVKYFLTPQGIASKLERTYGYIVRTYRELETYKARVIMVAEQIAMKHRIDSVYFFGPQDEFAAMLSAFIRLDSSEGPAINIVHEVKALPDLQAYTKKVPILIWDQGYAEALEGSGYAWMNIMETLDV